MKPKLYLLALALFCGLLPLTVQGVELLDREPGPRPRATKMLPVMIQTEPGVLTVVFIQDLGEVTFTLQQVIGQMAISQQMNVSALDQESFELSAGVYTLTITDATGNLITELCFEMP